VVPLASPGVLAATADRRLAASSILEMPEAFLRICVLASRRQRPVKNAMTHERNH